MRGTSEPINIPNGFQISRVMHKHKLALRARQTNLSSTLELTAGSMEEYLAPALVFLDAGLDPMEIVLALDDEIDDRTDGV